MWCENRMDRLDAVRTTVEAEGSVFGLELDSVTRGNGAAARTTCPEERYSGTSCV